MLFLKLFFLGLLILIAVLIIKSIKNERKRKEWVKTVKIGDECRFYVTDGKTFNGNAEIVKLEDDIITLKIKVNKRWIYPLNKK